MTLTFDYEDAAVTFVKWFNETTSSPKKGAAEAPTVTVQEDAPYNVRANNAMTLHWRRHLKVTAEAYNAGWVDSREGK
jgi:hypothetical protein